MNSDADQSEVLARFADGPAQLELAVAGLDEAGFDARASHGGWSVRQIVHHVADGDDLWKLGIKTALGSDEGEFTLGWYWALPQDVWAQRWNYSGRSVDVSLALFRANRDHVVQLLQSVPDAWERSILVRTADGKTESITVGAVVKMQAGHAMHHIKQIAAIREARESP